MARMKKPKMPKTVYVLPCNGTHYCSKESALYRCRWVQEDNKPGDPCLIPNCPGPVAYDIRKEKQR
jgi:hypothetical protein